MGRTALLACPEGGTSLSAMAGLDRSSFNTEPGLRSISFSLLCFCAVCCYAGSFFCCSIKKGQRPRPLRLLTALASTSPKGRGLGIAAKFTVKVKVCGFARGFPLRKDSPRSGGRCRAATKGGIWHRAAMAERASPLAEMPLHDIFSCSKKEPLHAVLCNGSF